MRLFVVISAILTVFPSVAFPGPQQETPGRDDVVNWVKAHIHPLTSIEPDGDLADLEPLGQLVSGARLVGLGEGHHFAREHQLLKARIIRYLVEKQGYTHLVLEGDYDYCLDLTHYLLTGEGEPAAIVSSSGYWFLYDTEEFLQLVRWMREYNADPAHTEKITVTGADICYPASGLRYVEEYVKRVAPELAEQVTADAMHQRYYNDVLWNISIQIYAQLSDEKVENQEKKIAAVIDLLNQNRDKLVERSSEAEFQVAMDQMLVARDAHAFYAGSKTWSYEEIGNFRDARMADITGREMQRHPDHKFIFWAHNFHLVRDNIILNMPPMGPMSDTRMVGMILSEKLGDSMVSVALTYNEGVIDGQQVGLRDPETLDAIFAECSDEPFLLIMKEARGNEAFENWMSQDIRLAGQGVSMILKPLRAYDAYVFVKEITRTTLTETARIRFKGGR